MANLRGEAKLLPEFALICTEKQFADLCASDRTYLEKEYVYVSTTQIRGELCGGMITGELPSNSIAIVPKSCSAGYLAFLLTSLPCQFLLFDRKINVKAKAKITRKAVSKLVAFEIDESQEHAYSVAESMKEEVYRLYNEKRDDLNRQHLYFLIYDLCNVLALEMFAHPMFEEMGIFILQNWMILVEEFEKSENAEVLFDGLVKSDSPLRNQIMKVHMLEDNFEKYIKEHTDGLED